MILIMVVPVVMILHLVMSMAVVVAVVVLEQPSADEVHQEADHGDEDRLVEADRDRTAQADKAFPTDQQCDDSEDGSTTEGGEIAELSGAEGEAGVARVFAGEAIGERRDQKRRGMGDMCQPSASSAMDP